MEILREARLPGGGAAFTRFEISHMEDVRQLIRGGLALWLVAVVLVAFLVTTILAFTQRGRPRALTSFQAVAQVLTWLALLVFGAFMPDFGDTTDSQLSLLTQVFGYSDGLYDLGFTIAILAAGAAVVAYLVLLCSLVFARREPTVAA